MSAHLFTVLPCPNCSAPHALFKSDFNSCLSCIPCGAWRPSADQNQQSPWNFESDPLPERGYFLKAEFPASRNADS